MLQPDTVVKNTSNGDLPNNLRPIAYASKTLSHTESNYSNIEYELLSSWIYQPGSQMHLFDAISRLSSHDPDKGDIIPGLNVSIHNVSIYTGFNATSLQTIHDHTKKDESFHFLLDHIHQGFPVNIKEMLDCIKPYFTFRDELAVVNGLIHKGDHIVIPKSLCDQCLKHLHKSHMGITKTLAYFGLTWQRHH